MKVETVVNALLQVGFDEKKAKQLVLAMEDTAEIKVSPAVAELKLFVHQEMTSLTWKLIGFMLGGLAAVAAILKYVH